MCWRRFAPGDGGGCPHEPGSRPGAPGTGQLRKRHPKLQGDSPRGTRSRGHGTTGPSGNPRHDPRAPLPSDGAALRLEDLASEGWIRLRHASLLDDYLARLPADAGLGHTVARASQISTAVRLVAQGLGVTVVPASAIPEGFEELACTLLPSLTEPVLVGVRCNPGSSERAMLDHLHQQNWCGTSLLRRPATD
ncbi:MULTISPECIES: LysR substrate-binding domain-containing protein [unclassified Streptomyces]|uniref:LysR substrate-binding domain-containing protein n=1 Tax=unclassified Streptomyces TaxID=2593676 RepID=UPI00403C084D